jgi:hypothetical protein
LNGTTGGCDNTQSESIHVWGGPLTRRALQAIYTIAFICLLRSDEVLKIRHDHIEFVKEDNNIQYMVLTLPFRKTHQDGRKFSLFSKTFSNADSQIPDVQPFYIYPLDEEEAHMCPVRAMAQWIKASKITSGFLFRKFTAQDRPSAHEDAAMVSHNPKLILVRDW